jgi:hypothetical protein
MVRRFPPWIPLVAASLAAACGSPEDDVDSASGAQATGDRAIAGAEDSLFGDDRVGRSLKDKLGDVPSDYPAFEKLFKVGRECKRADGKSEIFIVEEAQTRSVEGGSTKGGKTSQLLPRAVITGCNTGDTSDPKTVKSSYSLMSALISDPGVPGARSGDTMSMTPLEVMAFDDTTGLFNFYVFEPADADKPGTVTRFFRNKDGKVMQRRLTGGSATPAAAKANGDDACFRCHVNGAPLMNELAEPWTNWISPKKSLKPEILATMSGTTKELVEKASLADQLEGIIRVGTADYVGGLAASVGWLNRTRDGLLPGGITKLIEPLFCHTELNYLSADTTLGIPMQVFFDPSVAAPALAAGLTLPEAQDEVPFLFPVRAVRDEAVQATLVKRGYVTDGQAIAIRLLDDENDVFSTKRCGIFADVKKEIAKREAARTDKSKPLSPAEVKGAIVLVVNGKLPSLDLEPARLEYVQARMAGTVPQKKQQTYNAELVRRFETMDKDVAKRAAARRLAAERMFPNPMNPLPILEK